MQMQNKIQDNTSTAQNGNTVEIKNFAYNPSTITVKAGSQVVWKNTDSAPHSATADDGTFDTGILKQGESGTLTFRNKGTFTYHCSVHPNMKATVVVQ